MLKKNLLLLLGTYKFALTNKTFTISSSFQVAIIFFFPPFDSHTVSHRQKWEKIPCAFSQILGLKVTNHQIVFDGNISFFVSQSQWKHKNGSKYISFPGDLF